MADRADHQARRLSLSAPLLLAWLWAGAAAAAGLEVMVRTPAGLPIEDVAVVLEPTSGTLRPARGRATIEQRDREFIPYMTIVQRGTEIDFPNRDPFKHHVYSFSPAKVFEIKLYAGKPASPVLFDKLGEVAIGCNIHDWMAAHVLVVDTPWFAKTRGNGLAHIDRLPAGSYRLHLWHPRQRAATSDLSVDLGASPRHFDISLDVAPQPVVQKPPQDSGY